MKLNRPLDCSTGALSGGEEKEHVMLWLDLTSASKNALKGYFQAARSYVCYPSFSSVLGLFTSFEREV